MGTPAPGVTAPEFKPLARRAWLAQRWIGFTGVLALVTLGVNAAYLHALGRPEDPSGLGDLADLLWLVQLCLHILGGGIFIAWFKRAYENAPALGAPFLRHRRGWAIAAWFVPIIAWFWPKQMANDAWRASDPEMPRNEPFWLDRPVAGLVDQWWAAWVVASLASNAWSRLDPTTIDDFRVATVVAIVAQAAYVVAAVLCILFIRRLTAREEAKAAAIVPVLEITADQRLAAQQAARPTVSGRRIAWYFAGVLLVPLSIAAAVESGEKSTSVQLGKAAGYMLASILVGVVVVRLAGVAAKRRQPLMSGWAALVAVIAAIGAVSVESQSDDGAPLQSAAPLAEQPTADDQPTAEDEPAATPGCEGAPFTPGRLPARYRYSKARPDERRRVLSDMGLPRALARRTRLLYVMRGSHSVALLITLPDDGEHEAFVKSFLGEARRGTHGHVKTKQVGIGWVEKATLVETPQDASVVTGSNCTGIMLLGESAPEVTKLAKAMLLGA
jgi:hypothetical protein